MNWYSVARVTLAGSMFLFVLAISPVSYVVLWYFAMAYLVLDYILLCIFMALDRKEGTDATKKVLRDRG